MTWKWLYGLVVLVLQCALAGVERWIPFDRIKTNFWNTIDTHIHHSAGPFSVRIILRHSQQWNRSKTIVSLWITQMNDSNALRNFRTWRWPSHLVVFPRGNIQICVLASVVRSWRVKKKNRGEQSSRSSWKFCSIRNLQLWPNHPA